MKLNKDDLYWTNKKHTTYAVLVSPGYGAGWSTWNDDKLQSIAYDKRIVKYIIENQKDNLHHWSMRQINRQQELPEVQDNIA